MEPEQSSFVPGRSALGRLFRARKRREMLFVQVCFVCSILLGAWSMSAVLSRSGEWWERVCVCVLGGWMEKGWGDAGAEIMAFTPHPLSLVTLDEFACDPAV